MFRGFAPLGASPGLLGSPGLPGMAPTGPGALNANPALALGNGMPPPMSPTAGLDPSRVMQTPFGPNAASASNPLTRELGMGTDALIGQSQQLLANMKLMNQFNQPPGGGAPPGGDPGGGGGGGVEEPDPQAQGAEGGKPPGGGGTDENAEAEEAKKGTQQQAHGGNCWEQAAKMAAGKEEEEQGSGVTSGDLEAGGTTDDIEQHMKDMGAKEVEKVDGSPEAMKQALDSGKRLVVCTSDHAMAVIKDPKTGQYMLHDSGSGETRAVTPEELAEMGVEEAVACKRADDAK